MYVPPYNAMKDEAEMRAFVTRVGAAQLITVGDDGYPVSTLLPVIWTGDRVIAHLARANTHWRAIEPDTRALLVCQGQQAYVSPSWYAAKAEHGRVVPTWNYSAVELRGTVSVFHDTDRLHEVVDLLTQAHEHGRAEPWAVTDAPADYISGQLRGIVGLEMRIEAAEGKVKLSQNRSAADVAGVVAGLRAEPGRGARALAEEMEKGSDLLAFVSTTDLDRARTFYEGLLGLRLLEENAYACVFDANGTMLRVTAVAEVARPGYTVLGWSVIDIAATVAELESRGIAFTRYDEMEQDAQGVWTTPNGDRIAWFEDPDGNVLSLTQFN